MEWYIMDKLNNYLYWSEIMMVVKHQNCGKRKLPKTMKPCCWKSNLKLNDEKNILNFLENQNGENSKKKMWKIKMVKKLDFGCKHFKTG